MARCGVPRLDSVRASLYSLQQTHTHERERGGFNHYTNLCVNKLHLVNIRTCMEHAIVHIVVTNSGKTVRSCLTHFPILSTSSILYSSEHTYQMVGGGCIIRTHWDRDCIRGSKVDVATLPSLSDWLEAVPLGDRTQALYIMYQEKNREGKRVCFGEV